MKLRLGVLLVALALTAGYAVPVSAGPILVRVGDNDGYGVGILDNSFTGFGSPVIDNRSAAEAAATNGAQITDLYSALFPGYGPNPSAASVILPFLGTLSSGTLTIDMADFQATVYRPITANINGIALSLAYDDGYQNSAVRSFVLTPAQLAAANLAGAVVLNLDHTGSSDFIAFDHFELNGEASAGVPEPASLLLFGTGLIGLRAWRKRLG